MSATKLNHEKFFSAKAILFFNQLHLELPEALKIEVLNPYKNAEVKTCSEQFFTKYFHDHRKRIFIFGINPGRFGGGFTGISFTDPVALRKYCGIENDLGNKRELSSEFVYQVIEAFGGVEKFYNYFFMSAICPLGFTRGAKNYNYYDDKKLLASVKPFIKKTYLQQIEMGARNEALICLGGGKNFRFIKELNDEVKFFKRIIPLDHPRFIMQYRRKKMNQYIESYVTTLSGLL